MKEIMRVIIVESFDFCDQVKPHCHRTFSKNIKVPALEPNIENCELIRVLYEIHVKAKTSGLHRSINLRLPVVIGAVSLGDERSSEVTSVYSSTIYGTYESSLRGSSRV